MESSRPDCKLMCTFSACVGVCKYSVIKTGRHGEITIVNKVAFAYYFHLLNMADKKRKMTLVLPDPWPLVMKGWSWINEEKLHQMGEILNCVLLRAAFSLLQEPIRLISLILGPHSRPAEIDLTMKDNGNSVGHTKTTTKPQSCLVVSGRVYCQHRSKLDIGCISRTGPCFRNH